MSLLRRAFLLGMPLTDLRSMDGACRHFDEGCPATLDVTKPTQTTSAVTTTSKVCCCGCQSERYLGCKWNTEASTSSMWEDNALTYCRATNWLPSHWAEFALCCSDLCSLKCKAIELRLQTLQRKAPCESGLL